MNQSSSMPMRNPSSSQARGMSAPGVLVAEDDANLRAIMVDALRQEGFNRVYEASDGAICLTMLKQNAASIKVLVLDLMMPNQSGANVMETLHQQNPTGLGVLLVSGHEESLSSVESKYRTARVNFRVESLVKPFEGTELLSRIKGLLVQLGGPTALAGLSAGKSAQPQGLPAQTPPMSGPSSPLRRTPMAAAPQATPAPLPQAPPPQAPPPQAQVSASQKTISTTDLHRLQKQLASVEGQLAGLNSAVAGLRQILNELS